MCIICVKPKGISVPSDEILQEMFRRNPHGSGIAYSLNEKVHIHKGFMNYSDFIKELSKLDKSYDLKEMTMLFHFRITTSGNTDKGNCHPYPLNSKNMRKIHDECDSAIAHNGVLHRWTPLKNRTINDTQNFIGEFLNHLPNEWYKDKAIKNGIEKLIDNNKLAIIDKDDNYYLIGSFIKDSGCYYSNTNYRVYKPIARPKESKKGIDKIDDVWEYCYSLFD